MFSQKKKNRSWIYVAILLVLAVIAVFALIGVLSSRNAASDENLQQTNLESKVEEQAPIEEVPEEEPVDSEEIDFFQSYYLVKNDNNVIKIYFSDETGKLTELEATTIVYETLSTGDQERFKEGIKVDSRDDLNKLIMDYES